MTHLRAPRDLLIGLGLSLCGSLSVAQAGTYTLLHNFNCQTDGCNPIAPGVLVEGGDGSLYGTLPTQIFGRGTVFSIAAVGTTPALGIIHNLSTADGSTPNSGLTLGIDNNFYGTAVNGGSAGKGSVFRISNGVYQTLYSFTDGLDGAYPSAPPIQAPDLNIYGVTFNGSHPGVIYRLDPSGTTFTALAQAPSATSAPLIVGTDGSLYGTTQHGGAHLQGTVFKFTPGAANPVTVLYSFTGGSDGGNPIGAVMFGADGNLYGTTSDAGAGAGQGVVFKLNPGSLAYSVLHSFTGPDGSGSTAGLVQGSNGLLYGVTSAGGANSAGTLFTLNTAGGNFQALFSFNSQQGTAPFATPTLHTNGKIYGMTKKGGPAANYAYGVVYSYDAGLQPFAILVGGSRTVHVGDVVGLIGQNFGTSTGVQFGPVAASWYKIFSDSYILARVPVGVSFGHVTVLEPSGNLVTPQTVRVPRPVCAPNNRLCLPLQRPPAAPARPAPAAAPLKLPPVPAPQR